jgi:hypothetical protein
VDAFSTHRAIKQPGELGDEGPLELAVLTEEPRDST